MFDHVKFGVSDYAASKAFFLKALEPLGVAVVSEGPPTYGVELSAKGKASLCLYQTEEKPAHLHLAFTAANRQQVEAFYRAALEAGGKDNGAPGLRPHYHANYFGVVCRRGFLRQRRRAPSSNSNSPDARALLNKWSQFHGVRTVLSVVAFGVYLWMLREA